MTTDPRIAVLSALSSPSWHPVPEAHGMPWGEAEELLNAYRAAVLDEQGPDDQEALGEAAQMYRNLRPVIERTMAEPDRWDGDESEDFHLGRYVEWLAAKRAHVRHEELTAAADQLEQAHPDAAAELRRMAEQTVTEAEAERLANLTDCPNSHNRGLHCTHYREGDAPCCHCQRPNWCPDGGVTSTTA